ncbi:MAG: hypothetical protein ACF8GE_11660 [Phycisphaerales bacterium JB043]
MDVKGLILRFVMLSLSSVVVGPLAFVLWTHLASIDGGVEATVLVSDGVASRLARVSIVMVGAGTMGWSSARLISLRWGMWNAGVVVAWVGASVTSVDILRLARDPGVLRVLALESGLILVIAAGIMWLIARGDRHRRARPVTRGGLGELVPAIVACLGVAAAIVWIVAQEPRSGQVLWATSLGALGGALIGSIIWAGIRESALVITLMVLALMVFVVRLGMGVTDQVEAALAGSTWPLLAPTPLQWLSGALLGIPVGLSWGGSLVAPHLSGESDESEDTKAPVQA